MQELEDATDRFEKGWSPAWSPPAFFMATKLGPKPYLSQSGSAALFLTGASL